MAKKTNTPAIDTTTVLDPSIIAFLTTVHGAIAHLLAGSPAAVAAVAAAAEEVVEAAPKAKAPAKSKTKAEPVEDEDEDEDEEEEDEDEEEGGRKAELEGMKLKELQAIVIGHGYEKADVKDADKETLIETILSEEADGDDDDDEEEGEEESEHSRDDLEAMTLTALKKIAKEELELSTADLKGLDKESVVDIILGEADDDEGEEEEGEDEEADDEDDDLYTEDELNDLSLKELKEIAEAWDMKVKAGTKKPALVAAILAEQDEEADEDDDEDEDE